jgi:hypothetical protein
MHPWAAPSANVSAERNRVAVDALARLFGFRAFLKDWQGMPANCSMRPIAPDATDSRKAFVFAICPSPSFCPIEID